MGTRMKAALETMNAFFGGSRRRQFAVFMFLGAALGLLLLWWGGSEKLPPVFSGGASSTKADSPVQKPSTPSGRPRRNRASSKIWLAWVEKSETRGKANSQSSEVTGERSDPDRHESSGSNGRNASSASNPQMAKEEFVSGRGPGKVTFELDVDRAEQALRVEELGVYLFARRRQPGRRTGSDQPALETIGEWRSPSRFRQRKAAYFRTYYRTDAGFYLASVQVGSSLKKSAQDTLSRWRESFRAYAVFRPDAVGKLRGQIYDRATQQNIPPQSIQRVKVISRDGELKVSRILSASN